MSPNRRDREKKVAGVANKNSPCTTSVLNLGNTLRVPGAHTVDMETDAKVVLPDRDEKQTLPTKVRMMSMLSMAVIPEERRAFRRRFRRASKEQERNNPVPNSCAPSVSDLCTVPISWIAKAFECEPFQLRCAGDMFPESQTESEFLNEFYVMDVVLNRAPKAAATGVDEETDYDVVRPVMSYKPEDLDDERDYFYRAAILFLPQCGKFYCHRERRKGDVGVPGTFVAHDMSWLRLQRKEKLRIDGQIDVSYSFGMDSFVKRFFVDSPGDPALRNGGWQFLENCRVSAWRISTGRLHPSQQNRVIYRAVQCHDVDGPMLPPDILQLEDRSTVPEDYQAAEYRRLFESANSAKKDGRHYVRGCHHYALPESCWIINPMDTHFVDIMIDTDAVGGTRNRQSVVMVRNVTKVDKDNPYTESLDHITAHNVLLRKAKPNGSARSKSVDVGKMHAIGTAIPLRGVGTVPFAANRKVPEDVLRQLVVNLSKDGSRCFPQVYSVIRDMEQDSGLLPVEPMDGQAITDDEGGESSDDDNDGDIDIRIANARAALRKRLAAREKRKRSRRLSAIRTGEGGGPNSDGSGNDDVDDDGIAKTWIALRKRIAMLERRRRVGYTIDMSVNLGNASHFDVHDASQGFSVWTEEVPDVGENWFLILPNVHGMKPDGTEFRGMAVKLGHGVAVSWDGRVIRHCSTSISHPDGKLSWKAGKVKDSQFHNHLYGTFTAAKEKIIRTGRAVSAAGYRAPSSSSGPNFDAVPRAKGKRKGRRQKGRKSRRGRRDDASDAREPMVGVVIVDSGRESDASSSGEGDNWVRERYSDVGGDYKIPRKR